MQRFWGKKWWLVVSLCILLLSMTGCGLWSDPHQPTVNRGTTKSKDAPSCASSALTGVEGYWPMDVQTFQGVFQFVGQNNPKNAPKAGLTGANLEWSWAKVEPEEGVYNWNLVDQDMRVWTSLGKPVILRFATGGQKAWSGSVNGSYTPSWLFDTYGVPRITERNGTVFPQYWHPTYFQKLRDFVQAVAARYDTNPFVAAVEIGVGQGGETEPDGAASNNPNRLQLWQQYGYTNALWWQTIQQVTGIYEQAWKHTPLALMVTSSFLQAQDAQYNRGLIEKYAVRQGIWLQINSLDEHMSGSIFKDQTDKLTTTIEEQKQSAADSGYPALNDVRHGIALGARYVLIFASDIANATNADALHYAQQHIQTPVIADCARHHLNLSVTGRVSPVPGSSGQSQKYAQFFDGSSGSIDGNTAPVTRSSVWSMEAWLYPTDLVQNEAIAVMNGAEGSNAGGYGFGIAGGANGGTGPALVAYFPGVGWIDSGYTFTTARQWYDVVMTRDGNTVRFYVNGVQTGSTSTEQPLQVAQHFSIGSSYDLNMNAATHFFTGAIDEVALYAKALTSSQIKNHYRAVHNIKGN